MREVTCDRCGRRKWFYEVSKGVCTECAAAETRRAEETAEKIAADRASRMILTTETAPPLPISARLGIVGGQCALGMGFMKDLATIGRDLFGGRSSTLQQQLAEGRETVLGELRHEGVKLGADAVIAISFTFSEFSGGGSRMLFIAATGTAVKVGEG